MRAPGLVLILLALAEPAAAQPKPPAPNCYNKWAAKFDERGADEVADGTYSDVIVSNRNGGRATCLNGKAIVTGGNVVRFFIALSDGSFEEVKRTWKDRSNEDVRIINGISKIMVSSHGELFNVLWPRKIKPKK